MKKFILSLTFLVLIGGFVSAQQLPKIHILNNTGYPIYEVYISSSEDDYWGNDWLKGETISSGTSREFTLPVALSVDNEYDFCLVDTDDDTYTKMNVKLTNGFIVEFTFDDFDDWD